MANGGSPRFCTCPASGSFQSPADWGGHAAEPTDSRRRAEAMREGHEGLAAFAHVGEPAEFVLNVAHDAWRDGRGCELQIELSGKDAGSLRVERLEQTRKASRLAFDVDDPVAIGQLGARRGG